MQLNSNQALGSNRNLLLPELTNLNTWLTPSQDGKTINNIRGTDATFTNNDTLSFDGTNDFIQANNTGLGAGNFYYEIIFKFSWTDGTYIFVDGDSSTNNRWFGLQYRATTSGLVFNLDGDGTKNTETIFSSAQVSDDDIVKVTVKREGTTLTADGVNLTQSGTTNYFETNPRDFSGGNKLTIGALWSGSGASAFASFEIFSFKAGTSETDLVVNYTFAEDIGLTVFDTSGTGNHATITGASRSHETSNLIVSHNNLNGFNKDIFRGYEGHWDLVASGSGTFQANANNITLTGNTGVSGKLRQHVYGMASGDTLVMSGTIVQTGATGGANQDVAISSASAGWTQGSVFLGGEIGTYTFSTTFNANSSTCDFQFVVLNAAQVVISDLKFIVVKKIPALTSKTKQVVTFDGTNDYIQLANSGQSSDFDFGTDNFTIEGKCDLSDVGSSKRIASKFSASTGNRSWLVNLSSTGHFVINVTEDGTNSSQAFVNKSDVPQTVTHWKIVKNGTTASFYFDDIQATTVYDNTSLPNTLHSNTTTTTIGDSSTATWDRALYFLKVTNDTSNTVILDMDFSGNIGSTTVTSSHVGTNHDGTITNATLSSFWGTRVVDTSGTLVSADYAVGVTQVTNPNGYVHNGSESGLDLITTDLSAADILAIDNSSATQTFVRRDANNSDLVIQLLQYSSALSDAGQLARTRTYVG